LRWPGLRRGGRGGCKATHVLLPAWCLLRRADEAAVIGAAAAGDGHRKIAGVLGRAASRRAAAAAFLQDCPGIHP
jgi:hypothetical protein